jgi:hypothetical protein
MLLLAVQLWRPAVYSKVLGSLPSDRAALTFVWVVAAFVLGQLLDSLRDLLEPFWDWWGEPVNWDFFFQTDRAKVDQLDDFYFTYYVFNANLVLPLLALCIVATGSGHYGVVATIAVAAVIVFYNARSLSKEIAKHTK